MPSMGPHSFTIRRADECDIPRIIEIWREGAEDAAGGPLAPVHNAQYEELLASRVMRPSSVNVCWVACRDDGQIVGWQSLTARANPVNYFAIVESSTYVVRRNGCPGIGKDLLRHALQFAADTAIEYVYGFCTVSNRASKILMRSLDFHFVGVVPESLKRPQRTQLEFWVYVVPRPGNQEVVSENTERKDI